MSKTRGSFPDKVSVRLQQARPGLVPQTAAQRDRLHEVSEHQRDKTSPVLASKFFDAGAMV
jgi:hypothetical protein